MVGVETVTVQLGEREYRIAEAPRLRAKPWRERLLHEVKPLFDQIQGAQNMTFAKAEDLLQVVPLLEMMFVDAMDVVWELLIAYSAVLEADKEYLEANATDKQILAAFQEVVRLADPFGMVAQMGAQMSRQIGRRAIGT